MLGCGHSGNATAKPSGQPYRAGRRDFVGYVAVLFDDDWGSFGGVRGWDDVSEYARGCPSDRSNETAEEGKL